MKKIAHRILALVVALSVLLIPTAAFAEGRNTASLTIGNLEIAIGEETVTLPVSLTLTGGADIENARGVLGAALSTSEATALSALATLENGEIRAMLDGMNYGLYASLESIAALIEAETGMTIEDMMTAIMEEVSAELPEELMSGASVVPAELIEALEAAEAVVVEPQQIYDALGIVLTEGGETSYSFFDEEMTAALTTFTMETKTLAECVNAVVALDPAYASAWAQYEAYLNEMMAAEGESMTISDFLNIVSISLDGEVYANESGRAVEVYAPLTAEGETMDASFYGVTLTDEYGTYGDTSINLSVDGEVVYLGIYGDTTSADGIDSWSVQPYFGIADAETLESDTEFSLMISSSSSADTVYLYIGVDMTEYDEITYAAIDYVGDRGVFGETDLYTGLFSVYAITPDMEMTLTMDTALELSTLPAGELLTLPEGSIDIMQILTEGNEDVLNQLAGDAQIALTQGMGVLMQDPALASILSNLLG